MSINHNPFGMERREGMDFNSPGKLPRSALLEHISCSSKLKP